jgi:adenylate cyclase
MALSAEHRMALFDALGCVIRGWALTGLGQQEGIEVLRGGVERWKKTGARSGVTFFNAAEAWALVGAGRHQEALAVVDQGMKIEQETGELIYHAELLRLRAEARLAATPSDPAACEALLREALAIARRQKARSFELRIALSFCRLFRTQGRDAEALDLLQPIHAWFTQGLDTIDLTTAGQLLHELRGGSPEATS